MAAAFRLQVAARKLVGVQRTRPVATTAAVSARSGSAAEADLSPADEAVKKLEEQLVRELRGHVEVERTVQQKKEELYDAIAKAQQSFWTSSWANRRLLQHLSVQVKPRPNDSEWRRLRFSRRASNVLETAGLIALTGVLAHSGEYHI